MTTRGLARQCLALSVASAYDVLKISRFPPFCHESSQLALSDRLCADSPDSLYSDALSLWAVATGSEQPPAEIACFTSSWTSPLYKHKFSELESRLTTPRAVACLRASATQESSSLFTALPSTRDATRLSDDALTIAVGLRLGLPIASPGVCSSGA